MNDRVYKSIGALASKSAVVSIFYVKGDNLFICVISGSQEGTLLSQIEYKEENDIWETLHLKVSDWLKTLGHTPTDFKFIPLELYQFDEKDI